MRKLSAQSVKQFHMVQKKRKRNSAGEILLHIFLTMRKVKRKGPPTSDSSGQTSSLITKYKTKKKDSSEIAY
jgi:hypothetical protein